MGVSALFRAPHLLLTLTVTGCASTSLELETQTLGQTAQELSCSEVANNTPYANDKGTASTFSSQGLVDLENEFHTAQGSNGRSCASCHLVHAGWSIRPEDVEHKFKQTDGTDPIFNLLDADSPTADVSTAKARYAAYSMLRKGLFRRGGALPANAEFEIIALDDPLASGASLTRFEAFRRPLATANFHIARNVGWHDQNTNGSGNVHAGLVGQAAGNITGAQAGPAPAPEVVDAIVAFEASVSFAQLSVNGVGLTTDCGALGGAENLAQQPAALGPFDLFDAWRDLTPGSCTTRNQDRRRAQIARGQALFNATNVNGRSCVGCHNAANNGSNINGTLFDIGASRAEFREAGMPLYTLRNKSTGQERQTTDPGRAIRSGLWLDVDRFKVPSMRGLAARAPYFHNGIAKDLNDVVEHYEAALGFVYTQQERRDLVAFMSAL